MDDYEVHNIALKTLKQRCEYLQQRLNAVEEENCKLKLEKAQDLNNKTSEEANGLEQRIIILNEEKSKMAHQIHMILTENFNLWSQLSQFLPGNNISSIKFSISAAPDNQLQKYRHFGNTSKDVMCDYEKESLEEISLKLINGIIMGKNELEEQYSQMIDLQKEHISENKILTYPSMELDSRAAVKNLKNYVQKLRDFRQVLYEQKNEMTNTISLLKTSRIFSGHSIPVGCEHISNCEPKSTIKRNEISINQPGDEFSTIKELGKIRKEEENSNSIGICPMCGESIKGEFKDLYKHVSEHFEDENDEFVDASSAFEIV